MSSEAATLPGPLVLPASRPHSLNQGEPKPGLPLRASSNPRSREPSIYPGAPPGPDRRCPALPDSNARRKRKNPGEVRSIPVPPVSRFLMHEPGYVRTPEGIRYRDTQGRAGPPLREALALMYDREEGVLLKHGEASPVEEHFRRYVAALAGTTLVADIELLVIDTAHLAPPLLDEVNRAIRTSGYIAKLARRLDPRPHPGRAGARRPDPPA